MTSNPSARKNNLVVREVGEDLLIYYLNADRIHQINQTTNAVWRNCDGLSSVSEIAVRENLPVEYVAIAIEKLQETKLLENKIDFRIPSDRISRRKMLLKAGTTAALLPLISTITAPMAIHAQSGCLGLNQSFDITTPTVLADATACTNELIALAATVCCAGDLNPGFGSIFSPGALCRGFCG